LHVYLDESGDLGFEFSKPYHGGGSSRYLTIAFLLASKNDCVHTRRFTRKFKRDLNIIPSNELKGSLLGDTRLQTFAGRCANFLRDHSECRVLTITANKQNVIQRISSDANKLYNYMIRLCLLDEIKKYDEVRLIPDPRSIKVKSGNSMVDYLQTILMFDLESDTRLIHNPLESHHSLDLQFIDVISHIVWKHHEYSHSPPFLTLSPYIKFKHLYF